MLIGGGPVAGRDTVADLLGTVPLLVIDVNDLKWFNLCNVKIYIKMCCTYLACAAASLL